MRDLYSILQLAIIRWYYLDRRIEILNIYIYPPVFHPYFNLLTEGMRSDFEDFILHVCLRDRENLITWSLRSVIWSDYLPFEWRRVILKWFRFNFQDSTRRVRPDIR